ncbi:sulfatase [Planctomicrobium sp. SH668]|uniref:sulfatase n=1 Tax=Planctomicrobium sp. SH668 TaxID=3448126 RepID=UPI003F5AEA71
MRKFQSVVAVVAAVAAAVSIFGTVAVSLAETPQPNIVFILADDLGATDLSSSGSQFYETPNIDRLGQQGITLRSHHHCQNCTPTRAALMSGQYAARTGVYTVGNINRFDSSQRPLFPVENVQVLPLDRSTIANQLKEVGYATALFGKWHLGAQDGADPGSRGFDETVVSSGKHINFTTTPKIEHEDDAYLADFLTDHAVDFIERNKEKPFFLYLPHFGVHAPFQAKKELVERFKNKAPAGGHFDPTYAAMIYSVDESVGRVLDTLDKLNLAENTIVIFASDNGGVGGYSREGIEGGAKQITDNAPLRSGKGSLYEGGTRVPFIVKWPGKIPAGSNSDVPTIHVDFYPTVLELARAPAPKHVLDGESLVPLLKNPEAKLKRDAIYQHFPGYLGAGPGHYRTTPVSTIQKGDWKLLEFLEDGRIELYNLRDDVGETTNLAKVNTAKTDELHKQLAAWRDEIGAPMPIRKKPDEIGEPTKAKAQGGGKKKGNKANRSEEVDEE